MKEVYIDTNVILRLLLQETPGSYSTTKKQLDNYINAGYKLRTTDLVIAETFYMLESKTTSPKRTRLIISKLISDFSLLTNIDFPSKKLMGRILNVFEKTNIDFEDIHLFFTASTENIEIFSLDKDLKRLNRLTK